MENQQDIPKELLEFRKKIDEIDDKIINLLNDRIKIITEVGEFKKSINDKFLIKSAREADMIRGLVKKADPNFPKEAIIYIWRKIITSANVVEQNVKIALHNPQRIPDYEYLIKEYYGNFVEISTHDSTTNIVSEIEKNNADIAIFALPDGEDNNENWWINIGGNSSNIKVFARIPFIYGSKKQLVALAIKDAEKSEDDKTLLVVETPKEIGRSQILQNLKDAGLEGKILKSATLKQIENINFYLIEIDGFFLKEDAKIASFSNSKSKPYVKVIGNYPTPIEI